MKIDYTHYYRKWHDDSDAHRAAMISYSRNLLESRLPADKNAKVLDVGCGMGFALLALRELGFQPQRRGKRFGPAKSCRPKIWT